jgi:MoxR-like ATPase
MVLATQNPIEHHGTYPLPESQLDRFMLRIRMGYPSRESEKEILQRPADAGLRSAEASESTIGAPDVLAMQQEVEQVRVEESLLDYALEIIDRTRQSERLTLGVSPRGSLMLRRAAQARAFIEGRNYCLPDDFKQLVLPVFVHRVAVNTRYANTQKKSAHAEGVLREIVDSTPVPL